MEPALIELNKKRLEEWNKTQMTVKELHDKLEELMKQGHGDAFVSLDDNCGGTIGLLKTANFQVLDSVKHGLGKWVDIS